MKQNTQREVQVHYIMKRTDEGFRTLSFPQSCSSTMNTLLLIGILVGLVQAQTPPLLPKHLMSSDLGFTPVDYGGNHPFERRRKLEDGTPDQMDLSYPDKTAYESLRIKFITDPIQGSTSYTSNFADTLQEILDAVTETWSRHLFVYPVNGAIPISAADCFGFYENYIPTSLKTNGVDDADMVIYVAAGEDLVFQAANGSITNYCDQNPTTLAFATACSLDQFDRPVMGAINFCLGTILNSIGTVTNRQLKDEERKPKKAFIARTIQGNNPQADVTYVAIHEVAHALGFSLNLFPNFRDSKTGEPLTPRPFVATDVTCVDGTIQNMIWPANNTIQTTMNWDGRIYHEIVTPRVTQVVRNQFNCQNLTGARLGNTPTSSSFNCTDSHWDERLFLSELMGPIFSGFTDALSPLTLALFEDSGWYKVSYETAEQSPFGMGRGCDFVNQPCIINDGIPEFGKDIFCNSQSSFGTDGLTPTQVVCEPTHKAFAACDLFDINNVPADIAQLVPQDGVRYFSNTDLTAVLFPRADSCPLPLIPVALDCTNTIDNTDVQTYQGESRGLNSRCINGEFDNNVFPGCFEIECDATQHKVIIAGMTCDFDGQLLSVSTIDSQTGTLECPYLATVCPGLFCPGECSGRGVCDYDSVPPRCICSDTADTTAACSKDTPQPSPTTQPQSTAPPTTSGGEPVPAPTPTLPIITQPPSSSSTSDASTIKAITVLHCALIVAFQLI